MPITLNSYGQTSTVWATYGAGSSTGTGTGKIKVQQGTESIFTSESFVVSPAPPPAGPIVDVSPTNSWDHDMALCTAACSDAVESYSTPSYVSFDVQRSLTLIYRSAQAAPRGTVLLNVTDTALSRASRLSVQLKNASGALVTLLSGGTEAFYWDSVGSRRLAVQFSASSLPTGLYAYSAIVTGYNTSNSVINQTTAPVNVLVVNEASSPYGAGWSLANVQRIYFQTGYAVITDGDGGAQVFQPCSTGCNLWYSSAGNFSKLTQRSVTDQYGAFYDRTYPDGGTFSFNTSGYLVYTKDRFGNQTTYTYNGSNQLTTITDPANSTITLGYAVDGTLSSVSYPGGRQSLFAVTRHTICSRSRIQTTSTRFKALTAPAHPPTFY